MTSILSLALAGCAGLRSSGDHAEAESRRLAEQARLAIGDGDLARARELLARAISTDPENAELHRERARLMLCEGQCGAAVEHLQQAVAHDPHDAAIFVELAAAQAAQQHWGEAHWAIEAALECDPDHAPALVLAAQFAERRGDEVEALALYHRVLRLSDSAAARLGVAGIHLRHGRVGRAAPLLRAVGHDAQACPADRVRAFRELGAALARDGRWAEAADAFAAVVQFETGSNADDWYRLADVRIRLGDLSGARQALARARALDPNHDEATRASAGIDRGRAGPPAVQTGHTTD